jgi:hypothetical protein
MGSTMPNTFIDKNQYGYQVFSQGEEMEVDPQEWIYCAVCNRVFRWNDARTNEFGAIACRYSGCDGLLRNFHYFERLRASMRIHSEWPGDQSDERSIGPGYYPELTGSEPLLIPPRDGDRNTYRRSTTTARSGRGGVSTINR